MKTRDAEWFDLSKHPIECAGFSWGGAKAAADDPYRVDATSCIGCGRCLEVCPVGAVTRG